MGPGLAAAAANRDDNREGKRRGAAKKRVVSRSARGQMAAMEDRLMAYEAQMISTRPAPPIVEGADDYRTVQKVIEFLLENWRDHPSLETIAAEVGMEPTRLQKLFTRWAGISPKEFLQAITIDHARALLEQSATVLDTTYEVGLSGP